METVEVTDLYQAGFYLLSGCEVLSVALADLDLRERIVLVRDGKGGKDRYVPFSQTARTFLQKYLDQLRPRLVKTVPKLEREVVFLRKRKKLSKTMIWMVFAAALKKAGIKKKNRTVHSIRHSCATHLLEAGADVRTVSEFLGHTSIEITARYTHVQLAGLKKQFKKYHPRENELYREVDDEYRTAVSQLKAELLWKWRALLGIQSD